MQAGGVCDGCMVMGTPYFVTDIEGVSVTPNIEFGFALGAFDVFEIGVFFAVETTCGGNWGRRLTPQLTPDQLGRPAVGAPTSRSVANWASSEPVRRLAPWSEARGRALADECEAVYSLGGICTDLRWQLSFRTELRAPSWIGALATQPAACDTADETAEQIQTGRDIAVEIFQEGLAFEHVFCEGTIGLPSCEVHPELFDASEKEIADYCLGTLDTGLRVTCEQKAPGTFEGECCDDSSCDMYAQGNYCPPDAPGSSGDGKCCVCVAGLWGCGWEPYEGQCEK